MRRISLSLVLSLAWGFLIIIHAQTFEEELDDSVSLKPPEPTVWAGLSLSRSFQAEKGEDHVIEAVALTGRSDNCILATGGSDGLVRIWSAGTGTLLRQMNESLLNVNDIQFDNSGHLVFGAGSDKTIKVWLVSSGELKSTFAGHDHIVESISINRSMDRLASAGKDGKVIIRHPRSGKVEIELFPAGDIPINHVAFSPNGKWLVTAVTRAERHAVMNPTLSHKYSIWKTANWEEYTQIVADEAEYAVFSPDSKHLATMEITRISLRDVPGGEITVKLEVRDSFSLINAIAFHPDGKIIATGDDEGIIRLWDANTGAEITSSEEHDSMIMDIAFNDSGSVLASGDEDGVVVIWKVTD